MRPGEEKLFTAGLRNLGSRLGRLSAPEFKPSSIQGVSVLAKHLY
jgi:hypothetical protein